MSYMEMQLKNEMCEAITKGIQIILNKFILIEIFFSRFSTVIS